MEPGTPTGRVKKALDSLTRGRFVLVYDADNREEEVDFVIPAHLITPEHIKEMRKNGGGLICTAFGSQVANRLGLPYMVDVIHSASKEIPLLSKLIPVRLPYDTRSAFSLTVNHRKTYTGITDRDRAFTIQKLGLLAQRIVQGISTKPMDEFVREFRTPGHVHLLRASEKLLETREGHTELSIALCMMAGLPPASAICEMMGEHEVALEKEEAKRYATEHGYVFLEGWEIKDSWETWKRETEKEDNRTKEA